MSIFQIGGPVIGKSFYDREEILKELNKEIIKKGSLGFALYGLRRIGKSSILKEFAIRAKNKAIPIFIDVTNIHPFELENFYDTIFAKTIQAFKENKKLPIKINVLEALRSMTAILDIIKKPEISLNIKEYLEIKIAFKEGKTNLQELLNKSFSLIENLSKETKTRAILILDEFQLVQDLEENITWAIRSIVQNWKSASIIVAGSEISMLKQMTSTKTSPFYMLFKIKEIEPFNKETSMQMLKEKFNRLGIKIDANSLNYIYDITKGYPFYLQWLGDKILDLGEKAIDKKLIDIAYNNMLVEGEIIFAADLEKISNGEKNILFELSKETVNLSTLAKKLNKPIDSIAKLIERLVKKSYLKKIESGLYDFIDPLLKDYLRKK